MELVLKDDAFKILQLTDLHISSYPFEELDQKTIRNIKNVINQSNPDLIVLTGDIIFSAVLENALEAFKAIADVFNAYDIPISMTYGNHDSEVYATREELRDSEEYFKNLAEKKHERIVDGKSAYCVEVKNTKNDILHVLYFLDSGDYTKYISDEDVYDHIHPEHVIWFMDTAKLYKNTTDLAFLHIPFKEYQDAAFGEIAGNRGEESHVSYFNSGLFTAFLESGTVKGVFCGHDHDNDFIVDYHGITLGYGRVSGYNCYGELDRGARTIILTNNRLDTEILVDKHSYEKTTRHT